MRASLHLRRFNSWDTTVLHDEGMVLGVQPAGQSDDQPQNPAEAKRVFRESKEKMGDIIELILVSQGRSQAEPVSVLQSAKYRPGTAFIIMSMDKKRAELADVMDLVKTVFEQYGITAVRADDIEHDGQVTPRVLDEIKTAEFLFADLTGERPNVYYEVGYAHALQRRVILYRKAGTGLHFDLAGYNCPEYENLRDLREKLTRRLASMLNRSV